MTGGLGTEKGCASTLAAGFTRAYGYRAKGMGAKAVLCGRTALVLKVIGPMTKQLASRSWKAKKKVATVEVVPLAVGCFACQTDVSMRLEMNQVTSCS